MSDWNVTIAVYGVPGTGKSTVSLKLIRKLQEEAGAYALVFEGQGKFPRRGGDGRRLRCVREHVSANAFRTYLATPHTPSSEIHIIRLEPGEVATWRGEPLTSAGLGLVALAEELAKRSRRRVIVWFGEIAWVAGANQDGKADQRLISAMATRRHAGLLFGWESQSPTWPHRHIRKLATERYVFRITDEYDLAELRRSNGVPKQDLPVIARLEDHRCLRYA